MTSVYRQMAQQTTGNKEKVFCKECLWRKQGTKNDRNTPFVPSEQGYHVGESGDSFVCSHNQHTFGPNGYAVCKVGFWNNNNDCQLFEPVPPPSPPWYKRAWRWFMSH